VIELLAELRDMLRLAYIFIAHDLPVVRHFTDRVMVMFEGKIVEQGRTDEIFARLRTPTRSASSPRAPSPTCSAAGTPRCGPEANPPRSAG
jgi:peptide/nickel transport system ATP-binding protein